MTNLNCTIFCLVFLLAHLDLKLIQCFTTTATMCPRLPNCHIKTSPFGTCYNYNDQDCEERYPGKGLKCCLECGSWKCVSPTIFPFAEVTTLKALRKMKYLTKLVAKCPTSPPSSTSPPGPDQECQNDASCDAKFPGQGLKCCSDGWDFRCFPPVIDHESVKVPGHCPAPPPINPRDCDGKYFRHRCYSDSYCELKHPMLKSFVKCCMKKCASFVCMIPILGKAPTPPPSVNGTCPIFPLPAECPPEPKDKCKNDETCNESYPGLGLKCCKNPCNERRCIPPSI